MKKFIAMILAIVLTISAVATAIADDPSYKLALTANGKGIVGSDPDVPVEKISNEGSGHKMPKKSLQRRLRCEESWRPARC